MAEAHEAAMQCQALGIAGASGVLVVLCPERFCNGRSVCCLCLSKHSGSAGASTQHPAGGLQAHLERRGDAHWCDVAQSRRTQWQMWRCWVAPGRSISCFWA